MAIEHTFKYKGELKVKKLTGMSAIREKCLDCSNWNEAEVRNCEIEDCALWPFRFGRYPKTPLNDSTA